MLITGICGSLRKDSYNRALLQAALQEAPDGVTIQLFDKVGDLPLYNEDIRVNGYPDSVQAMQQQIIQADALLIVTPEYNYGIPGALKNLIDWASRPMSDKVVPLVKKPIAIMGATSGAFGTVRAQSQLRQNLPASCVLSRPEVLVTHAAQHFDAEMNLINDETRRHVRDLLQALMEWTYLLESVKK